MQTKSKRNMEIQARKKNEKIMQICVFLRFMICVFKISTKTEETKPKS